MIKLEWQRSSVGDQAYMSYGDCDAQVNVRGRVGYDVIIWMADEHVFDTRAATMELGQKVVEDWLEANYPL